MYQITVVNPMRHEQKRSKSLQNVPEIHEKVMAPLKMSFEKRCQMIWDRRRTRKTDLPEMWNLMYRRARAFQ